MAITFDRGDRDKPKGHALLYFRGRNHAESVLATYIVILPITVDVSKYVPPFLMNQIGEVGPDDMSAFAFPPAPETVPNYQYLEGLGDARGDDIVDGGIVVEDDVPSSLMAVSEAVQEYADLYALHIGVEAHQDETSMEEGLEVNEVVYGLMSDSDRLTELTKLVGKLRFSAESNENSLASEAELDIRLLSNHLPENHQASQIIQWARSQDQDAPTLTDLYLKRCFHLIHEEYVKLGQVENEIRLYTEKNSAS